MKVRLKFICTLSSNRLRVHTEAPTPGGFLRHGGIALSDTVQTLSDEPVYGSTARTCFFWPSMRFSTATINARQLGKSLITFLAASATKRQTPDPRVLH